MHSYRRVVAAAFFLTAVTAPGRADSARDALVVTPAWLAQHLNDSNLVILHVGPKGEYDAKHIAGARYVSLADISVTDAGGLTLELPPTEDLRTRLANLGVSDSSRIVVYFSVLNALQSATRVVFTLDYAGLGDRTSLLDGGLEGWVKSGQPVTDAVPAPKTGTLAPLKVKPLVVDAEYVLAHLKTPKVSIVDARLPAFFSGAQTGGSTTAPHRTGHIAGAHNVPYAEILDADQTLRSTEELAALFAKAGIAPGDTVVTYCHIGQQATATLFAARALGYQVLLYDGSFQDWSKRPDYPVEIIK